MSRGIIALDIDGTVTAEPHATPPEVVEFLATLQQEGWHFIFITGRTFQWGIKALQQLPFPYHFAVNNGALLLEMPSQTVVQRKYLNRDKLMKIRPDCVLYGGYESGDLCYYCPHTFTPALLDYLKRRTHDLEENWVAVDSWDAVPLETFAAAKFFAEAEEAAQILSEEIEQLGMHAPAIRDPYNARYFVIQATHAHVSKGETLEDFKAMIQLKGPIIAAGDDNNDRSMLAKATIKIAMATAPEDMRREADVIAPPAAEKGIIQGLKEALCKL